MSAGRALRATMHMLKGLARRYFWRHAWVYADGNPDYRVCAICDRCELSINDGFGPDWIATRSGAKARHDPRGIA